MKVKPIALGFVFGLCVVVQVNARSTQEEEDMMNLGDDEDEGDEGGGEIGGDAEFVFGKDKADTKKKTEKKAAKKAGPVDGVPSGQFDAFIGSGYAVPVIGLTYSHLTGSALYGGVPITVGGQYYIIDNLAVGARLRLIPLLWTPGTQYDQEGGALGADEGTMMLFDFQAQVSYCLDLDLPFTLHPYVAVGGTYLKKKYSGEGSQGEGAAMYFSGSAGAAAVMKLTELGPGDLSLDFGLEIALLLGGGNSAKEIPMRVMYPLALVGLRYGV